MDIENDDVDDNDDNVDNKSKEPTILVEMQEVYGVQNGIKQYNRYNVN